MPSCAGIVKMIAPLFGVYGWPSLALVPCGALVLEFIGAQESMSPKPTVIEVATAK